MDFDPKKNLSVIQWISGTLGAPVQNVKNNYPLLYDALGERKLTAPNPMVIAIATAGVECGSFRIVHEIGTREYFDKTYGPKAKHPRKDYELEPSGLWKWRGRGLIQLTGRDNYLKYGKLIGVDLIAHPDQALDPKTACRLFAAYFFDHGCGVWANKWANEHDKDEKERALQMCRRLVNGGLNGYPKFRKIAELSLAYSLKPGPPEAA